MLKSTLSLAWMPYSGKYAVQQLGSYAETLQHVKNSAAAVLVRPAGQRGYLFQNAANDMFSNPKDNLQGKYGTLWWPNGIADWKQRFTDDVEALFSRKVQLDYVVLDIESGRNCWNLDAASLAAIYADPRYQTLVATGDFPADCRNMSEEQYCHFNYGCAVLFNAAVAEAIVAPLHARYPNVPWSNFQDYPLSKADALIARELNGHPQYLPKSTATHYSPAFYGTMGQIKNFGPVFKLPWGCLALSNNTVRGIYRANPSAKIMPWLAPRAQADALDLPHWQELIYHMFCQCGPQALYFNAADFTVLGNWRYDNSVAQFIAQSKGSAWKSCLTTTMTDYNTATVEVSAARLASGATLGRATFKPGVTSATVKVAGKAIVLKRPVGQVGVWFRY